GGRGGGGGRRRGRGRGRPGASPYDGARRGAAPRGGGRRGPHGPVPHARLRRAVGHGARGCGRRGPRPRRAGGRPLRYARVRRPPRPDRSGRPRQRRGAHRAPLPGRERLSRGGRERARGEADPADARRGARAVRRRPPPRRLTAMGSTVHSGSVDVANVQIGFESGTIAVITASRATEEKIRTLAVTQPDAYIVLDYAEQDIRVHRRAAQEYTLNRESIRYRRASFVEHVQVHKDNPLKLEILNLALAVKRARAGESHL